MPSQKITIQPDYRKVRASRYPDLRDFADAVYWAERGDRTKLDAWLTHCDAVKAAAPKPPPDGDPNSNAS